MKDPNWLSRPGVGIPVNPERPFFSVLVRGTGVEPHDGETARWAGPLCTTLEEAEGFAEQKRRGKLPDGTDTPSGTAHGKEYVAAEFVGLTAKGEWPPAEWPAS